MSILARTWVHIITTLTTPTYQSPTTTKAIGRTFSARETVKDFAHKNDRKVKGRNMQFTDALSKLTLVSLVSYFNIFIVHVRLIRESESFIH